jgi:hypothetical protein
LREVVDVDVPHDGVDGHGGESRERHHLLALEQLPSRPLEKAEHRGVIHVPEHVAVSRVHVEDHFRKFVSHHFLHW